MKVHMDRSACASPDCRECLDRCPEKVFGVVPRGRRDPIVPGRDWMIAPVSEYRCTGCMECETFCSSRAITVH